MPFVLGQALYMQALHSGQAQNAKIDSPQMAARQRGGLRPQAYGYPAEMRATRALLRHRLPLRRQRAAR